MFKSAKNVIKCLFTSKQDKIKFLEKKVYAYYYTIYSVQYCNYKASGVNIPDFILNEQAKMSAFLKAKKEVERVVKQKAVSKCFMSAIK